MLVVISYDTPDDARRRKIVTLLRGVGERVQYSVFEAHLEERDIQRLRRRIRKVIDQYLDSVRFYKLGTEYEKRVEIEGYGTVHEEVELIIL
jgi:CRISPR-associated protein Cas2